MRALLTPLAAMTESELVRVRVSCQTCFSAALKSGLPDLADQEHNRLIVVPFVENRPWAIVTCTRGHTFQVQLNDPTYALFYERALQRFVEKEWRDAVLDAYTALDMFLTTVPVRARYDRDPNLAPNDIHRLREELAPATNRSEKAIGAALAVISVVSGGAPPKLKSDLQNIRNDAVHAGRYPTQKNAEFVIFEVESVVVAMEEALDKASVGRDPPFNLARQIADFAKAEDINDKLLVVGQSCVFSWGSIPRIKAHERVEHYRTTRLSRFRLD
jgi:hypothetical protein